jgi:hypothetical protein
MAALKLLFGVPIGVQIQSPNAMQVKTKPLELYELANKNVLNFDGKIILFTT